MNRTDRMLTIRAIRASAPLVAAAALLATRTAAAINCDDPSLPNPIYIVGSTAVMPYMAALGTALAGNTTIIYNPQGSCVGVDAIFNGTKTSGTVDYWDKTGTLQTCTIDPPTGVTVDIGVSDVFSSSCAGFSAPPAGVGDFYGPNQVMNFVVPIQSSQTTISAQAAYFAYGFGANSGLTPWNNPTFLFQRSSSSGTQSMISAAIGVPSTKWLGTNEASSSAEIMVVSGSSTPESTLGILVSGDADANRSTIRALAYQHYGQDCAWLPDSSSTSFDKKNVRDGHYPIWGPIHFFAPTGSNNMPTNAAVATFLGYFTGTSTPPSTVNLLKLAAVARTVPACAMSVSRTTEVGPVSAAAPTCGCAYDFYATGATTCGSCTTNADCTGTSKNCRYGYCEAN